MFSVIASFFAAATAGGKAQQQHGGASPASEQARQTDRPAGRASQASSKAHPVGSTPFKKMEKKNLPWLLLLLFMLFAFLVF